MAVVLIDIIATRERATEEVVSDHYWYDQETRQLIHMKGGSLAFRYAEGKMMVSTQPLFAIKYSAGSNKSKIIQWIEDNMDLFNLQIVNAGPFHIAVSFDDHHQEAIEDSLYSQRFEYDILGKNA